MTATEKKAAAKKAKSPNQPLPEGMFGTAEAAKRMKIEPRALRVWLRSKHGTNNGERYAWDEKGFTKLAAEFAKDQAAEKAAEEKAHND